VSGTTGIVFDIQHYAVHDGPGIRTLVFLKGCPLGCVWCSNPESQSHQPQLRRIASRCKACLRCAGACPISAIGTKDGSVRLDRVKCACCEDMACVAACCSQALSVVGESMAVGAVVARVAADREFYRNSGGGVTFSGGEPFVQSEFLVALLAACRELGIHTAVETCGHVGTATLLGAEPLVDLFLFDLKLAEGGRHQLLTGVDNRLILDNFAALAAIDPTKIVVRVPLIPGLTDDEENLRGIADVARASRLRSVQLQPYHPLGRDKYEQLGMPRPPEVPPLLPEALARALALFSSEGFEVELA
jgi:pyruvate formate lyase activating enzyme